jgi:tetratricopeptide (TPR) repeat protein
MCKGAILHLLYKPQDALKALEEAVVRDKNNAVIYSLIGEVLCKGRNSDPKKPFKNDYKKAVKYYNKALELSDNKDTQAWKGLCYALNKLEKKKKQMLHVRRQTYGA